MARHMMTARRKAALRKAQLASARKRKGRKRTSYQYTARSAFVSGLALGRSSRANSKAGFHGVNKYIKTGKTDKRHRIKKNKVRRAAGYFGGVLVSSTAGGLAVGALTGAGTRAYYKRKGYL